PDHRRARDEVIAVRGQLLDELDVLAVALDELVLGMAVVRLLHAPVLAEVVDAHDLVAVLEQLGDEIPGDESVRAGDEGLHRTLMPSRVMRQMSTTGFPR